MSIVPSSPKSWMTRWEPRIRRIGWSVVAVECLVLACTFFGSSLVPSWVELPLGQLEGVAIANDGTIYTASAFYSRIQAYSPSGAYLRGWPVRGIRYLNQITVNHKNEVAVLYHGQTVFVYSEHGDLLKNDQASPPTDEEPSQE